MKLGAAAGLVVGRGLVGRCRYHAWPRLRGGHTKAPVTECMGPPGTPAEALPLPLDESGLLRGAGR